LFELVLQRSGDQELGRLIEKGFSRRYSGKTHVSRLLRSSLTNAFDQMHRITRFGGACLQRAVRVVVWDALREELFAPRGAPGKDSRYARLKGFIEMRLSDPDLSVETIAQGCGMSVRTVQRAFADDQAGSVSNYIWKRRLGQCAAVLRDPLHAHRSITEICFSWGFSSASHFSRMFKIVLEFLPGRTDFLRTVYKPDNSRSGSRSYAAVLTACSA
jgi:AraC family transcriptional regulator, positive regulator of tynA and feaB